MSCRAEHVVGERVGDSLTVVRLESVLKMKANESSVSTLRDLLRECLGLWSAPAAAAGIDVEGDDLPLARKYRKLKKLAELA